MNALWIGALSLGGVVYVIFLALIIVGLLRLRRAKPPIPGDDPPSVSIVIAARNEAQNIRATLEALSRQNYPADRCEIIVVDDRSDDDTSSFIREFIARSDRNIRLISQNHIDPQASPKKQALEKGIAASTGEIIFTTDADCIPPPDWIKNMTGYFGDDTGMVIGQARFFSPSGAVRPDLPSLDSQAGTARATKSPLWQRLQALDFASQGIASAGLAAAGAPFNCSGASLAFRRGAFDGVGGWRGVRNAISGDDEFLLAKIFASGRWKVAVATGAGCVVPSRPVRTPAELWHQRARWGSKGMLYTPARRNTLAGVFLFCICLALGPVVWALGGSGTAWLFWAGIKTLLDATALRMGARLFGERIRWSDYLLAEFLHPAAIALFALGGQFGSFEWKGARYRTAETVG